MLFWFSSRKLPAFCSKIRLARFSNCWLSRASASCCSCSFSALARRSLRRVASASLEAGGELEQQGLLLVQLLLDQHLLVLGVRPACPCSI